MPVSTEEAQKPIAGLRVIVVDDVSDSRDVVEMYLMQKQAKVKAVSSARDALQVLNTFEPELIISDVYMPGEDGYWLIEQLNSTFGIRIPTIAITAAAREEDRDRIMAAGYDGYLAKPFMFEDLTTLIAQIMSKSDRFKNN